jgi:hypothetical protein
MVLIFGFGPGQAEDLGEVAPVTCPNCHNLVFLHRVRTKKSVRLYFVPVVPYGTDEYLLCPVCSKGAPVPQPQRTAVSRMQAGTKAYRARRVDEATYRREVSDFLGQIGLAPTAPAPAAAAPAPIAQHGAMGEDWVEKLAQLEQLHQQGVLTDEEFATAKRRVLDQ